MAATYEGYKPDHKGIQLFLHSSELDDALKKAGDDVIALARGPLAVGPDMWFNDPGGSLRIRKYTRETRKVGNQHPAAAAREFGSGKKEEGRPQGGSNEPTRALGRAGIQVGDYHGGADAE
jgi:hypothetical protein